jgi:hypothetical protein
MRQHHDIKPAAGGGFEGYGEQHNWTHISFLWDLPYTKAFAARELTLFSSKYFSGANNVNAQTTRYHIAEEAPMTDLSAFQWDGKGVRSYTSHLVGMKERNKLCFSCTSICQNLILILKSLIAYIKQTNNLLKRSWITYA